MIVRRTIYSILLMLTLTGCGAAEYVDISSDVKYAHLIDTRYQSLQKLRVQGITLERNYGKKIDVYYVSKYPGSGGPETIFVSELLPHSIFKVKSVVQSGNYFFSSIIAVRIEILSEEFEKGVPIRLYKMLVEDANGQIILDPKFLRKLP